MRICVLLVFLSEFLQRRPRLYEDLRDKMETYLVGDAILKNRCENKRVIHHAIEDAYAVANRI